MRLIKRAFMVLVAALVAATLHYNLPKREVVRILDAYEKRVDFGDNAFFWAGTPVGMGDAPNRDVRFIDTVRPNGRVRVFRNEDTGWGWPPYFKMNASNLGAQAKELVSTRENPTWVLVTHYGWRSEFLSIFPNAIRLREVDSPDMRPVPWFNIAFLIVFALVALTLWRLWRILFERRISPVLRAADRRSGALRERLRGWRSGV